MITRTHDTRTHRARGRFARDAAGSAVALVAGLVAGLSTLFAVSPAAAQPMGDDEHEPARPMLVSESAGLVAGATNNIALTFDIDEGWHVYWPGQNDTGFAPSLELTLPEGWTASDIQWPAPHRHVSPGGILDHVYEDGEATFIIPITVPSDAEVGPVTITADAEWLVCREACIPGWQTVTLETRVVPANARVGASEFSPRFEEARTRHAEPYTINPHPRRLQPTRWATLKWQGGDLQVSAVVPPNDAGRKPVSLAFYPDAGGSLVQNLLKTGESTGDASRAPAPLFLKRADPTKPISGIIEVRFLDKSRPALYRIESRPLNESNTAQSDSQRPDPNQPDPDG